MHDAPGPTHAEDEPEIHLPPPSFSPALVGLGAMLLAFGILYGIPILVLGLLCIAGGVATWLIDDARQYVRTGDPGGDGHGHGGH